MKKVLILLPFALVACTGIQPRYHEVAKGETLDVIAQRYDIPVEALRRENKPALDKGVVSGIKLYLPFESRPDWDAEQSRNVASLESDIGENESSFGPVKYKWPVEGGHISSYFGKRKRGRKVAMHEGIDIAAQSGTPVYASRSGHVIYAGSRISGYGKLVIVRHADRYSTVYAHLSKILVKKGDFLSRGATLGKVGNTGRSHGAHLHFELRSDQTPVDPLLFLQGQYATNTLSR